jgi:hypothetical protein
LTYPRACLTFKSEVFKKEYQHKAGGRMFSGVKGWELDSAARLYWATQECADEKITKSFHFDVQSGCVTVYVFCGSIKPREILMGLGNIFKNCGLSEDSWDMVVKFKIDDTWRPYNHQKHSDMPGIFFGWRFKENILL